MLQLSAWLVVMSSVLGAVEPGSSDDEGSNIAADVFAAVDANKDGVLKHPETAAARKIVADKMQATMIKPGYISGGTRIVERMRQLIMQTVMDLDRDGKVDQRELAIYVNEAIILREQALRTPIRVQWQMMKADSWGTQDQYYSTVRDMHHRLTERAKHDVHAMAIRQRQGVLFDAKLVKEILKMQMAIDYHNKAKEEAAAKKAAQEKKSEEAKSNPTQPEAAPPATPNAPQG